MISNSLFFVCSYTSPFHDFLLNVDVFTLQALLCILAENCDEASYKKLVQALCAEHQIPLLTVPDNMQLGKYAGLCKLDAEGNERKVVRCSSVVIRDWGKEGPAHDFLREHIKK